MTSQHIALIWLCGFALFLLAFSVLLSRRSRTPWFYRVLGGYELLLTLLFVVGLLIDDGWGWGYLPMMIACAPWSFMLPLDTHNLLMDWFASGLFGNFVLFVIICGGINCAILYAMIKRLIYPRDSMSESVVPHTGARQEP